METKKQPLTKAQKLELLNARIEKLKKQKIAVANSDKPSKKARTRALIQIGAYYCKGRNPFEVLNELKIPKPDVG